MHSTGNRYRATSIRAPATKALAVVGAIAAVLQAVFWLLQTPQQRDAYSWQIVCGFSWPKFQEGRWWSLFTYVLVQGGVLHGLAVLLGLYVFGRSVEPIIGSSHLLVASGLGSVVGALVHGMACQYGALPAGQALWGALPAVLSLVGVYSTVLPGWQVGSSSRYSRWFWRGGIRSKEVGWIAAVGCVLWWRTQWGGAAGPLAMLAALCVGWIYTRALGFGGMLFYQRILRSEDPRQRRLEAMSWEEFLNVELNPILEKIAHRGTKSLTRAERQTLRYSRRKLEGG